MDTLLFYAIGEATLQEVEAIEGSEVARLAGGATPPARGTTAGPSGA